MLRDSKVISGMRMSRKSVALASKFLGMFYLYKYIESLFLFEFFGELVPTALGGEIDILFKNSKCWTNELQMGYIGPLDTFEKKLYIKIRVFFLENSTV